MRKLIFLILLLALLPLSAERRDDTPTVLILHSYHPDMLWETSIRSSIIRRLRRVYPPIRIHSEFMDLKHNRGKAYLRLLREILINKYHRRAIRAIVALDDGAYRFLLRFRDRIFGTVPVVFCGVNHYDPVLRGRALQYTGVVETVDLMGTVALIRRLQPDLDTLYIINDSTLTGRQNLKSLHGMGTDFRTVMLNKLSMDSLKSILRRLGRTQAVILLSFTRDATGKTFSYRESVRAIRNASGAPVYGVWDFFLGRGIVGGSITSGNKQGEIATVMLLRVLRGENPDRIPVLPGTPPTPVVDYREAKKYNLRISGLPPGIRIINRSTGLLSLSRTTLIILVLLISTGAAVSLFLFCRLRSQQKRGRDMEEDRANYRTLSGRLEKRVAERTRMLVQANETLRGSLDELEKEANAARRIQFQLLPRNETTINGILFQHLLIPSRYVSGDFLNCFRIDSTRVGFYTADVAGHGLSAAFITVFLKGQMELQLEKFQIGTGGMILNPDELLTGLNETILQHNLGKHISLFYAILDTGQNTISCSNAGQYPFPFLVQNGQITVLDMKSPPLGLFQGSKYYTRHFPLAPDARLTIFSDGVLEVLPDQPLMEKEQRLKELVEQEDGSLLYYSGMLDLEKPSNLADDVTVMMVQRTG